jgi:hypothetical protein
MVIDNSHDKTQARMPIHDRHQVDESLREPDVSDVRAPDLIHSVEHNILEQVWINSMLKVRFTKLWTGILGL